MKEVFVVVVTYNGMKWLEKSLASVHTSDIPTRLIVVDNCSTDESVSFVKSNYPAVVVFETNQNLGFGGANNIGMRYALQEGADYVFLLNQDAYLATGTLRILVDAMVRNPNFGVMSPIQLNGDGSKMDRNFEWLMKHENCPNFVSDAYFQRLKSIYEVRFVMAALWLVNKESIERIGLFSPIFNHYGEDNDYLNRLRLHALKAGICTDAVGYHDREDRIESNDKQIYIQYVQHLVRNNDVHLKWFPELCRTLLLSIKRICALVLHGKPKEAKTHFYYLYKLVLKQTVKILRMRSRVKKHEAIEL